MPRDRSLGPRILFKPGPSGAYFFALHFHHPAIARMIAVAAETAPPLVGDVIVFTEAYRPARIGKPSLHPKYQAVDIRTGIDHPTMDGAIRSPEGVSPDEARRCRIRDAGLWAERMRMRFGSDFDVVFGDEAHIDHIHLEHDL
jgi:hypothetical protein